MSKIVSKTISCSNCGAEIAEDADFCPKCGIQFSSTSSSKGKSVEKDPMKDLSLGKKLGITTLINGSIAMVCFLVSIIVFIATSSSGILGVVSISFGFTAIGFGIAAIITGIFAIRKKVKKQGVIGIILGVITILTLVIIYIIVLVTLSFNFNITF